MSDAPPAGALSMCVPETIVLEGGQKARITIEPKRSSTDLRVVTPAISKYGDTTYTVKLDGEDEYGPAALPPTDVDDMAGMWRPAKSASQEVELVIKNRSDATRTYHTQTVGWEE